MPPIPSIDAEVLARPEPTGRKVAELLRRVLRRQGQEVMASILAGRIPARAPSLSPWIKPMIEGAVPAIVPYFVRGGRDAAKRIRRELARLQGKSVKNGPLENLLAHIAFDDLHPRVGEMVGRLVFDFCAATNQTSTTMLDVALRKLRIELYEGLERGEAIGKLTARVGSIFDDPQRAKAIARTESSRAMHGGQQLAAEQSGVVKGKKWLAKSDACDICLELNGAIVPLDASFAVGVGKGAYAEVPYPPYHPHCLLPETPVIAPMGVAAMVAEFDGPVVGIDLSDGSCISVTPNHMLLATDGFVAAQFLVEGDDVVRYERGQRVRGGYPDDDGEPVPVKEIVDAWPIASGVPLAVVPLAAEYLHGDAAFCDGHVHVVGADGLLRDQLQAAISQLAGQRRFMAASDCSIPLARQSDLASVLFALRDATDGGVSSVREAKASLLAEFRQAKRSGFAHSPGLNASSQQSSANDVARDVERKGDGLFRLPANISTDNLGIVHDEPSGQPSGFGRAANGNARLAEPSFDGMAADSKRLAECFRRFPSQVAMCKVVKIRMRHYRGPVYDIQTLPSMYLVGNGVVSSNCTCTFTEVLDMGAAA